MLKLLRAVHRYATAKVYTFTESHNYVKYMLLIVTLLLYRLLLTLILDYMLHNCRIATHPPPRLMLYA